jgi:hypothetical protein
VIKESKTCKARLLHYFPIDRDEPRFLGCVSSPNRSVRKRDSWCGWHNDHGALTGLCPAMFIDESNGSLDIVCPDPDAGLWVRTRNGKEMKVMDSLVVRSAEWILGQDA